jgi:hypothetical protein
MRDEPVRHWASANPGHRRFGTALVREDESLRVHASKFPAEFPLLLLDLRAVLLADAQDIRRP